MNSGLFYKMFLYLSICSFLLVYPQKFCSSKWIIFLFLTTNPSYASWILSLNITSFLKAFIWTSLQSANLLIFVLSNIFRWRWNNLNFNLYPQSLHLIDPDAKDFVVFQRYLFLQDWAFGTETRVIPGTLGKQKIWGTQLSQNTTHSHLSHLTSCPQHN